MTLGEQIKKHRKEKKLTQKQLADKTGIGVASIQRYERNEIEPTIETLKKICSILEISLTELIDGKRTLTKILCGPILSSWFYPNNKDEKDFCNDFNIDFDLFNKCIDNDKELPEDILIKICEKVFEDNSYDFFKFFQDNYDLISQNKNLTRFFLIKKGAANHAILRDAKIESFLKNITPKLKKYFDLNPSGETVLNKISDLLDYEIYRVENNKEGE